MYPEGQLLRFTPFVFKNGAKPKPKYFIVLKHLDDRLMMASLPTSQVHMWIWALFIRICLFN